MDDRAKLVAGSLLGAAAGVAVSYLFFTHRGRALRAELEPLVTDLVREVTRVQEAVQHVREGLAGDGPPEPRPTWPRRSA